MTFYKHTFSILLVFIVVTLSSCGDSKKSETISNTEPTQTEATDNIFKIHLDNNISSAETALIKQDFAYLASLSNFPIYTSPINSSVVFFREAESFKSYFKDRVKYITASNLNLDNAIVEDPSIVGNYPNTITPFTLSDVNPFKDTNSGTTIMVNIGSAAYLAGKRMNKKYGITLNDGTKIKVTSPRVGVIQIAEGLFELQGEGKARDGLLAKILRLSTYFHEGRHDDGYGEHLMFAHVKCPDFLPLAGEYACDANDNGPYSVDASAKMAFYKNENYLTESEREVLKLNVADSITRVVGINSSTTTLYNKIIDSANKYIKDFEDKNYHVIVDFTCDPSNKYYEKLKDYCSYKKEKTSLENFLAPENYTKYYLKTWNDSVESFI